MASVVNRQSTNASLEIDGKNLGWLKRVEPPTIEFVADAAANGPRPLKLGEFSATQAVNGTGGVLDWVLPLLAPAPAPAVASGAVILADANFRGQRRVDFTGAHITEVRFDDLDATSKQPFAVALKWQPASVGFSKASGAVVLPRAGKRKAWLAANFRLQGLPFDARFVTRVQWPVITPRPVPANARRNRGDAGVGFSEWRIEVSASGAGSADSVLEYTNQLIQDGTLTDDEYFDCSIELLDTSLSKTLATVTLGGCGLLRFAPPAEGGAEPAAKVFRLAFSVERFELKLG